MFHVSTKVIYPLVPITKGMVRNMAGGHSTMRRAMCTHTHMYVYIHVCACRGYIHPCLHIRASHYQVSSSITLHIIIVAVVVWIQGVSLILDLTVSARKVCQRPP